MDVTVFGGTGKIGRFVLRHLLDAGHEVTTLVRSPGKLTISDPHLTVVIAELSDDAAVKGVVTGADAVISTLGPPIDPMLRGTPLSAAMATIVEAMADDEVRRLVALSTVSVPDPRDRPGLIDRIIPFGIRLLIPQALREIQGITEAVTTSELDWTLVRILTPVDNPPNGTVRAGFLGVDDVGWAMTRTDIARFLVDQLIDDRFHQAAPAISN